MKRREEMHEERMETQRIKADVGTADAVLREQEQSRIREKRREQLTHYIAEGCSVSEIAQLMRIVTARVYQLCEEFGLTPPRAQSIRERHSGGGKAGWPDWKVEKLKKLHAEGLNDSQIAERMGVAPRTLTFKRQDLGLPANGTTEVLGGVW